MSSLSFVRLYWDLASFTECPLALILQVWLNRLCIHFIHLLHDFGILDYVPISLPLPKPRVSAFCFYLFPNSMTVFWRCRTTPVVAPHHGSSWVSVAAKWLLLSCSQQPASWCPSFAWWFWLLLQTELVISKINLKKIHPVKLDQSSLNTSIPFPQCFVCLF